MAEIGNGFFRELTETKERIAAWVFRLVLTALIALVGYLINDFKSSIDRQDRNTLTAIAELTRSMSTVSNGLAVLSGSFADHVKEDAKAESDFTQRIQDHETRLRTLERPTLR